MAGCQDPGPLEELRDTVKPYGRHVIVCGKGSGWGPRIEQTAGLLGRMAADVAALKERVTPPPKLTAVATPASEGEHDLMVFPDRLVYRGVDDERWTRVRDEHLVAGRAVDELGPTALTGTHILVCIHGARDERCGACGPLVLKAFRRAIEARGLDKVVVHPSSHVGGHRFAGNVLVYPGGVWYGYVGPDDVDRVLDAHVGDATPGVWQAHLRGRMITPEKD